MKLPKYETAINAKGETYIREAGNVNIDGRKSFNNPDSLFDFFANGIGFRQAADEHVYIACLDTKLHLIGCFEASHGSTNESMFPVREIFQKALLIGAVNIAIAHNHPTGDIEPSRADISATNRIVEAGKLIDIGVIDHIIIGANNDNYFSFRTHGYIK